MRTVQEIFDAVINANHPNECTPMRATAQPEHTDGLGPFDFWHRNKPRPFNPAYDPHAKARSAAVAASMEADGYYEKHSRTECASEWRRRYAALADLQESN